MKKEIIEKSYQLAKEQYAALGVDTDNVLAEWIISISVCIAGRPMMLAVLKKQEQTWRRRNTGYREFPGQSKNH